ncbi:STM3941 family protein [Undibacterium sp. Di27W]|uniref:STM3941 family protein n=1 Tax=Undibacterium sp. Di27W TaxID=3413036 RepID=UPI003BEFDF7F
MNADDNKIIELSKTKLCWLVAASMVFVMMGLWMLRLAVTDLAPQRAYNHPVLMHGLGIVMILFFGFCAVVGIKKLLDKKPGLVLNSAGILDNSSGVAAGFVPWSEITGFSIFEMQSQKMLVISLREPGPYIMAGGVIQRLLNKMNYKLCGSPVVISANSLKLNFDELLEISQSYLRKYGKNN